MMRRARASVAAGLSLFLLLTSQFQVLRSSDRGELKIVFLSNRDRSAEPGRVFDIFLLEPTSMKSENLTRGLTGVVIHSTAQPKLNANQNLVIFISSSGRSFVSMNLRTRTLTKITDVAYEATSYTISPDGKALLYGERVGTTLQLFEVDIAGGAPRNLTHNACNNIEGSYSPDGKRIVYVCDSDGSHSIAVMNRDGTGQKVLTNNFGDDRYPRWSPDSKTILFSSSRSGTTDSDYHLYTIGDSGADLKLFFQSKAFNTSPVYSPDTSFVAFVTNTRGGSHKNIVLKELATGLMRPVTYEMNGSNDNFTISDDGTFIVFENSSPLDSEIWMYDLKTKQMKNLSNHKARDTSPAMDERSQGSR